MRAGMPRHFRILTLTRRSARPSPGGRGTHTGASADASTPLPLPGISARRILAQIPNQGTIPSGVDTMRRIPAIVLLALCTTALLRAQDPPAEPPAQGTPPPAVG